jgi:hypothetical protein
MIIQPFEVQSRGVRYTLIDRDLLDSDAQKFQVSRLHGSALSFVQSAALCSNRGLADRGEIDNRILAILNPAGDIIGIWMLGCIEYVSGPWANLQSWEVTNPGADVLLTAVPMSGALQLSSDLEADLAADVAETLVNQANRRLRTGQGETVSFQKLSYGIFLQHEDAVSQRAKAHHGKVKGKQGLTVVETPHPTILNLTIAEISHT